MSLSSGLENLDEDFYDNVERVLHNTIATCNILADNLGILKPYSFVLENDDKETVGELYIADDDTVIDADSTLTRVEP